MNRWSFVPRACFNAILPVLNLLSSKSSNMKYILFLQVWSLFFVKKCIACFTEKDADITFSLIQPLKINSCVFVKQSCRDIYQIVNISKKFSNKNLYFTYFYFDDFLQYFSKGKIPQQKTMIVLKADNDSLVDELQHKISLKKYCCWFVWVMILPKNMKKFKDLQIPFNCQFIIARERDSGFELSEIFQVKDYTEMIYMNIANWDHATGITAMCCGYIDTYTNGRRRRYLSGTEMIAKLQSEDVCDDAMECAFYKVWRDIGDTLNFSTPIMTSRELRKRNKKMKFDVESLVKPYFSLSSETKDIIGPVFHFRIHVFIRFVGDNQYHWGSYIRPFGFYMWISISVWLILSTIIITTMAKFIKSLLSIKDFAIFDHAFTPLTAISYQGCFENPRIISYRIGLLCAFMAASVVVPSYSAAVISYLTVTRSVIPFTDLNGFVKDGTYKLVAMKHPNTFFILSYLQDHHFRLKMEKLILPFEEFPPDRPSMVEMLCNKEKIALFDNGYNLKKFTPSSCVFVKAIVNHLKVPLGIELQDNSPYRNIFQEILFNCWKAGIVNQYVAMLWTEGDTVVTRQYLRPIDLQMISSILILLMIGIILAVTILMIEVGWNYVRIRRLKNLLINTK